MFGKYIYLDVYRLIHHYFLVDYKLWRFDGMTGLIMKAVDSKDNNAPQ